MWDKSGAQWFPKEYKHRDPRFFRFDYDSMDELRLIDMADMAFGIPLPAYKFTASSAYQATAFRFAAASRDSRLIYMLRASRSKTG